MFSPQYNWKICWIGVKQQSLTHSITVHDHIHRVLHGMIQVDYIVRMSSSVLCMFMFFASCWRWDVVVHFVDSGGIVDHRCLNFLFIILFGPHIITIIETSFYLRVLCLKTLLYISWDIIHVSSSVIEWYIYIYIYE